MLSKRFFLILLILSALSFLFFIIFFRGLYIYIVSLHAGMLSLAMYFLFEKDMKATLKKLGFSESISKIAFYSIIGLLSVFLFAGISTYLAGKAGINDQQKVGSLVGKLPFYILAVAVVVAPFSEELFFRGLLLKKLEKFTRIALSKATRNMRAIDVASGMSGMLLSSMIFALAHAGYGSVVELVGAFSIGIALAVLYRHSKTIVPCIIVHFLFNLGSLIAMKYYGG
jgi:hypothetical protein